jgi:putative ABC transport system permease protein
MKFRRLFRFSSRSSDDVRADVREERQFHIDMRAAELARSGMSDARAREQAQREFGGDARTEAASIAHGAAAERRHGIARLWSEFVQDARYGARLLRRSRGFTAVAVLTIAVGIGGNTTVFSVANGLLLKPPPLADSQSIARIYTGESQTSWPNFLDIKARARAFTDVTAARRIAVNLPLDSGSVRLVGEQVSANHLTMLGVPPLMGRTFTAGDLRTDLVVLSERAWHARFGGDRGVIGRMITLAGRRYEVIAVMPRGFRAAAPPGWSGDFWIPAPIAADGPWIDRRAPRWEIFGRLRPGIAIAQAGAELRVLGAQLQREYPDVNKRFDSIEVFGLSGFGALRGSIGLLAPALGFMALMSVVSGFVLLIGCANLAGLLLSRAATRRREIAVRLALGAGRRRLVRQLLTESFVLASLGAAGGVFLAIWLSRGVTLLTARLPFALDLDMAPDARVLGYAALLAFVTTLLFGLAPARRASRIELVTALKDESGASPRQRMQHVLLFWQVAISTLLLLWSGLFLRSLTKSVTVDPGFNPRGVLVAQLADSDETAVPSQQRALLQRLQERVTAVPGVTKSGAVLAVPLALMGREDFGVRIDGDDPGARTERRVVGNRVSPGYFETLEIPMIAGRDFTWNDRPGAPAVVVVNETLARRFWNGRAIGQRVRYSGSNDQPVNAEVIGVVRDSKYWTLGEEPVPTVYQPLLQAWPGEITLLVRTSDLASASTAVTQIARDLAPERALTLQPMTTATAVSLLPARIGSAFTGGFGILAALLAAMGIYGVVAFTVQRRTREIGIRRAVGATAADIARLVLGRTLRLVVTGLAAGALVGIAGASVLGGFLVGVSPLDPPTLAGAAILLLGLAALASAVPAIRATRLDPVASLRDS